MPAAQGFALAQLVALGGCVVAVLNVALVRAGRPLAAHAGARLPPAAHAVLLEALIAAPWAVPFVALGLARGPSAASLAWPSLDHCSVHHDHHAHLCLMHPPAHATLAGTIVIGLVVGWVLVRAGRALRRELRAHAEARALRSAARRDADGIWTLATLRVICAVAGVRDPIVLVSDGARAHFDRDALEIALAHERAHVARRDVARQSVARVLASVHPDGSWMIDALAIARERACDERAAAEHDRLDVADALVRCARAIDGALPHVMTSFGPAVLDLRVRALLDEPVRAPGRVTLALTLGAATIALAAVAPFVHHALESVLGAIAH